MPTLRYRLLAIILHLAIVAGWNMSAWAQTTFPVPNVPGCSGVSGVIVNMRGGSGGASNSTGTAFPNGGAGGFGGSVVCTLNVYSPVVITSLTTYVGMAGAVGVPIFSGILGPAGGTGYGTGGNGGNFAAPSSSVGTDCAGGAGGGSSAVLNTTGSVPLLIAGGGGGGGALITTLVGGNGGNPGTPGASAGTYNLGGSGGSPGTFGVLGGVGLDNNGGPAGPAPGNGGSGGIGLEGSQSGGGGGAGYGGGGGGGAGNLPGVGTTVGVNTATAAGGGGSNYVDPTCLTTGLSNGTATVSGNGIVTLTLYPAAIGGTCITLCPGTSTTFTESTPGGTWSSSNPAVATVSASTGPSITVSGGTSVGTADISYTVPGGYWAFVKVTVVDPTEPITGPTNLCVGQTITLADATTGGTWSSGSPGVATIASTGVLTGVGGGIATITYTPASGCIATTTITVTPLPGPIGGTLSVCVGNTTTLTNAVPGGTWSSSANSVATIDPTSGIVSGLAPGGAIITYSFGGTCLVSGIVTVNALPVISIAGTTNPTTCFGSDGTITIGGLISGTTYQLDYSFNGTSVGTRTYVAADGRIVDTGLASGDYSDLYVTDMSTGCVSLPVGPVTLADPPNPPAPLITSNQPCRFEALTLSASDAWGGGFYSWTGPNGFTSAAPNDTIVSFNYADTGIYTVVYTLFNCASLPTSANMTLAPTVLLTNVTLNQTILYGSSIQLNASNAAYYMWMPHDGSLDNPNINNPVATPTITTTYTVIGRNLDGCPDSASVTITVDSMTNEFIASAFTPNGDGLNDVFRPVGLKFQRLVEFRVYNKWGQEVFSSNNIQRGWDGTFNGIPQDMGTYYYQIIIAKPGGTGENVSFKGDVTLIR